ncbi:MAG: OmpA family protein [Bacteroidales bacterium]|nr:OmpA family protein [Bacteroidales bacterium]
MKKLVIALAFVLTAGTMFAQDQTRQRWSNFETNRFIDNWDISLGAGVQTMFVLPNEKDGYDLNPEGFGKDFTLAIDAALTKWVTPIIGVRLGFAGLGYTNYFNSATTESNKNENKYWTLHGDLMMNLTNWICGYRHNRTYNAILFVGVGYGASYLDDDNAIDSDLDANREWSMPVGLINRFRLSDAWSLNIELRDLIVRNAFSNYNNNVNGPASSEYGAANILSVTAGVTYRFGSKDNFKSRNFVAYAPIDKSAFDNRIASLEKDLQNEKDQNAEYQRQLERYKKALDEETRAKNEALAKAAKNNPVMVNDDVTLSIFFPIGSAEVSDKNQVNIQYMADVIKASKSSKVYTVTGYADKATGSENRNLELSQQRAEAVRDALINAGVDANKVKVDYKGCSIQPFEKDYLNRVAIIK